MGIVCVLISWMLCQPLAAEDQSDALLLIGNQTLSDYTLSQIDVQNIFLGKKKKLDNHNITFVILKSGEIHEEFLKEFLARTPSQFNRYWKKMVFTGKGKAPKVFQTEEALLEYVRETEDTVGYLSAETMQAADSSDVHQFVIE